MYIYSIRDLIEKDSERDRLLEFFMDLNESYAQFCSNILLMKPLPPVSEVYPMATQEERQRQVSSFLPTISKNSAFRVNNGQGIFQRTFN